MASRTAVGTINNLKEKKDAIENEMKELMQVLETQGVGMTEKLVDDEDYPRADVDIYSIRHARHKIKCLQNDHKNIMKQLEEQLYIIHAEARERKLSSGVEQMEVDPARAPEMALEAFAHVNRVDEGSPASQAGMKVEDDIVKFGSITASNFENIRTIGNVVQHSQGIVVPVIVQRSGKEMHLSLTPQTWAGQGLLGCNIVPVKR